MAQCIFCLIVGGKQGCATYWCKII